MPPFSLMGSIPGINPVSAMEISNAASSIPLFDSITFNLVPVTNARLLRAITIQRGQTVVIGRSSHDVSKGLSVGIDNALFDCPVVSRRHAELVWRASTEGSDIAIIDASSSHGTFINGTRLEHNKEHVLKSGDQIRLGCEINSSLGAHEGVTFNVIRVGQSKATKYVQDEDNTRRGFRVYGDDESEMESVVDDGDESSVIIESADSSNNTTPDSKAVARAARLGSQNQPIDLEQPNLILRKVIDVDEDDEVRPAQDYPTADAEVCRSSHDFRKSDTDAEQQPPIVLESPLGERGENELHEKAHVAWGTEEYIEERAAKPHSIVSDAESESGDEDVDDEDIESQSESFAYINLLAKSGTSDVPSEPYSDDEGPERMSSKKEALPEFNDTDGEINAMITNEGPYNPPRTMHYDPVRGSQPPASGDMMYNGSNPKPRYTYGATHCGSFATPYTDFGPTGRWDAGPTQDETSLFSEQPAYLFPDHEVCRSRRIEAPYPGDHDSALQSHYYSYPYSSMPYVAVDQSVSSSMKAVFGFQGGSSSSLPASTSKLTVEAHCHAQKSHSSVAAESDNVIEIDATARTLISQKRKADDISQDDTAHAVACPDVIALRSEEAMVLDRSQAAKDKISIVVDALPATAVEHPQQPAAKRVKSVVGVARSAVKTATKVLGYTALGGMATAYFLQSPVAEALCEWL